jgi:NAD(P)-dependent dehydrogenase (short-subunit alcohol dehydrogenase family)
VAEALPVVVTGAASGIGRAVAQRLLAGGTAVVALDVQDVDMPGATSVAVDLTDASAIGRAVDAVGDGPLGGLVNCAGLPGTHPPARVLAVNLLAPRRLTAALAPRVAAQGAVVNVASVAAHRSDRSAEDVLAVLRADDAGAQAWLAEAALDGTATYDFSKKALLALTLADAARLLERQVRCLSVSPGPTETPILEDFGRTMGADRLAAAARALGGHATADDVAAVIEFLLSDGARWVSGIDVRVDRGLIGSRLAPDLATEVAP